VSKLILTLDIGGSKILAGLFNKGQLKKKTRFDLCNNIPLNRQITSIIDKLFSNNSSSFSSIKIACPGPADYSKGIILSAANLNAKNFKIKKILEERYKVKVLVENDANCFAYYEWHKLKKFKNLVGITLGTGIGVGVVINNKIFHGRGLSSELGHIIIKNCELEEEYKNIILNSHYPNFKEAYESDKKDKYKIFIKLGNFVATVIYNAILAYDPEIIILGGGVIKAKKLFWDNVNKRLSKLLRKYNIEKPFIKADASDLGVLKGAAIMPLKKRRS